MRFLLAARRMFRRLFRRVDRFRRRIASGGFFLRSIQIFGGKWAVSAILCKWRFSGLWVVFPMPLSEFVAVEPGVTVKEP
jgi:hypothetical protein